jgi:hypothetical protein
MSIPRLNAVRISARLMGDVRSSFRTPAPKVLFRPKADPWPRQSGAAATMMLSDRPSLQTFMQPFLASNDRFAPIRDVSGLGLLSTHCRHTDRHTITQTGNEAAILFVSDRRAGGAGKRDNLAATKSCFLAPCGELRPREVESLTKLDEHV